MKTRFGYVLAGALAAAAAIGGLLNGRSAAQIGGPGAAVGPRYTVVQTDAVSLLVTDNATNTTLFYTVDEGGKPGDDLKLRGSVDLSQVGGPVIKVRKAEAAGAPAPAPAPTVTPAPAPVPEATIETAPVPGTAPAPRTPLTPAPAPAPLPESAPGPAPAPAPGQP